MSSQIEELRAEKKTYTAVTNLLLKEIVSNLNPSNIQINDEFQQTSLPETPLLQLSPARLPSRKIHHSLKKVWDWNHFQISLPDDSKTTPPPVVAPSTSTVPTWRSNGSGRGRLLKNVVTD